MQAKIDHALLQSLVEEVETFRPVVPVGNMHRMIQEIGFYEQGGVIFVQADFAYSHLYAGLAVLARDIYQYLCRHPRTDAFFFLEVFYPVRAEVASRFRRALPKFGSPPMQNASTQLSTTADLGRPVVAPLGGQDIIHEWTFKLGKKLYARFLQRLGGRFIATVFCKDGPFEQFNTGALEQNALSVKVAATMLEDNFSPATIWYPLVVYLSLLLTKTRLKVVY